MLKKYTAILFLTIAYAILLGHNFIPHHHHNTPEETNKPHYHHSHTNDHHHSHDDSGSDRTDGQSNGQQKEDKEAEGRLSHLLSHFVHSAEGVFFINSHNISNTFPLQVFSIFAVATTDFYILYLLPPLLLKPPLDHFTYSSPSALFSGLRAPPVFIV